MLIQFLLNLSQRPKRVKRGSKSQKKSHLSLPMIKKHQRKVRLLHKRILKPLLLSQAKTEKAEVKLKKKMKSKKKKKKNQPKRAKSQLLIESLPPRNSKQLIFLQKSKMKSTWQKLPQLLQRKLQILKMLPKLRVKLLLRKIPKN